MTSLGSSCRPSGGIADEVMLTNTNEWKSNIFKQVK
jgi:hypothetical protein